MRHQATTRYIITALTLFFLSPGCCQQLVLHSDKVEEAGKAMENYKEKFAACLATGSLDNCVEPLLANATDSYKKYIVAGWLYNINDSLSFLLHEQAYLSDKTDKNFVLEYAIELHRKHRYEEAAKLYEAYNANGEAGYKVNVWLADCYINTGNIQAALMNWEKAGHARNHTGIDKAIYDIYGRTDQMALRAAYRNKVEKGESAAIYPLIFMDMNWELDWWNKVPYKSFLDADMQLVKQKLPNAKELKIAQVYMAVKGMEKQAGGGDSIEHILTQEGIIVKGMSLPLYGHIASDMLRICFTKDVLSEKEFYKERGEELLELATKNNDIELLNIYAYLQAAVNGKVEPGTDRRGWTEFNDSRFAFSYFIGKAEKNRYDDPELAQALKDFPDSSPLWWVKLNCAKIEGKELKPLLVEVIKREFRTLERDGNHYSYSLKTFFGLLSQEN